MFLLGSLRPWKAICFIQTPPPRAMGMEAPLFP
jgi:hypothetical protein